MKIKFFVLALVLCLSATLLCACGGDNTEPTQAPETTPSATNPATNPTDDPTASATETSPEPTDKGIFIPDDDIENMLTFPEELEGLTLPEVVFGDDVEGVFESHPVNNPQSTESDESTPEETQEPATSPFPTYADEDVLPEHIFED